MRRLLPLLAFACTAAPEPEEAGDTAPPAGAGTGADLPAVADTFDTAVADTGAPPGPTTDTAPPPVSLFGATVTFTLHCCDAPPSDDNDIDPPKVAVVGQGLEFPSILDPWATLDADVDLTAHGLTIAYRETQSALGGGFNGYVFTFENGAFTRITDVRLDRAASTVAAGRIRTHHTDDAVWVDVANLQADPALVIALEIDAR